MTKIVLVINICKERLHYYEFVKPIEDILLNAGVKFYTKHYTKVVDGDLKKADKMIICGTSLKDNDFLANCSNKFRWLKYYNKPILGICGGMHAIGVIFGGLILDEKEIGLFEEKFTKDFLGIVGKKEVYHLHGKYIDFFDLPEFGVLNKGSMPQCVKHISLPIYGVLFHPEVRNKELIQNFLI